MLRPRTPSPDPLKLFFPFDNERSAFALPADVYDPAEGTAVSADVSDAAADPCADAESKRDPSDTDASSTGFNPAVSWQLHRDDLPNDVGPEFFLPDTNAGSADDTPVSAEGTAASNASAKDQGFALHLRQSGRVSCHPTGVHGHPDQRPSGGGASAAYTPVTAGSRRKRRRKTARKRAAPAPESPGALIGGGSLEFVTQKTLHRRERARRERANTRSRLYRRNKKIEALEATLTQIEIDYQSATDALAAERRTVGVLAQHITLLSASKGVTLDATLQKELRRINP